MIQNEQSTTDAPPPNLTVGGSKGHEIETIDGNLLRLYLSCRWKPLPRCTGRYTCRDHDLTRLHPLMLAQTLAAAPSGEGNDVAHRGHDASASRRRIWEFTLPGRDDAILVVPLDPSNRTGIISYKKESPEGGGVNGRDRSSGQSPLQLEASYVHTLNAPSGFRRKLHAMGLTVTDDDVVFEAGRIFL
jgi:hypothetical protein